MASPERKKDHYSTADLCLSAMSGRLNLLHKAIASGCGANRKHDDTGLYPLHCAVKGHSVRCVQLLLSQADVDVNCLTDSGETPLHLAVQNAIDMNVTQVEGMGADCLLICEELVKHGGDVLAVSADGKTPLHCALGRINSAAISLLKVLLENDCCGEGDVRETMWELDGIRNTAISALRLLYKEVNSSSDFQPGSDSLSHLNFSLIDVAQRLLSLRALIQQHGVKLLSDGFGQQLKSVLLRCVQSEPFASVLSACRTFDERSLCFSIGRSLSLACKERDEKLFATMTRLLSRPMVQIFNRFSDPFRDQPLVECLKSVNFEYYSHNAKDIQSCYQWLQTLLRIGFDPNVPTLRQRYQFDFIHCHWALLQNNLFTEDHSLTNIVSFLIERAEYDSQIELKTAEFGLASKDVFRLLLSFNADLNYKSPGSAFKCPDFVLAAAVAGGYFLDVAAERMVQRKGLNPSDLLSDLAAFSYPAESEDESIAKSRARLVHDIASFLIRVLPFALRSSSERQLFRTIVDRLVGRGAEIPKPVAKVYEMFDAAEVPTLQSVCRATIRKTIARGKLCAMKYRIDQLPFPKQLKRYLMFEA